MEFGMFHEFPSMPGRGETEMFDEAMAQVDAAERWGLDVMWLAEIHFAPERTYLSSPLAIASAIAARTKRMKIGIAVQVLPLCHPLRLAEEAATVDQISEGRLIFGVGRSGVVGTYDAYQVPYDESRERFAEIFEIVKRAWSEKRFSYQGKFHSFDNVACVPHPYRNKLPPIRIAASTPDTFPAIGGQGYPVFASVRHVAWPDLAPQIRSYYDAYKAAGHPGRGQVYVSAPIYLAETEEQAAIRADRRFGAALRPAGLHRSCRTAAHADLCRCAARQCAGRHAAIGWREAAPAAGGDRLRRDPRRTQLRRPHSA